MSEAPCIYLVGFMGAGKTTIGRLLAGRLGRPFVDIDDDIEAREGTSISEIFATRGEEEFRRVETEAIRERVRAVKSGQPLVLALGGGAFARQENREAIEGSGVTMWLDCPFEIVERRVARATHRPLARDPERFARLYSERAAAYARAHFRVPIAGDDPEPVIQTILDLLGCK